MKFNPLCCSIEDENKMVQGYLDGFAEKSMDEYGAAYSHGYNNGRNDRDGVVDETQLALARRVLAAMAYSS